MSGQVFRISTYDLADSEYDGLTARVHLKHTLSTNYFVMIKWGLDSSGAVPDSTVCRVTGDPHGTGDLTQVAGNWLELTRGDTDESLIGSITVWECLVDPDGAGFRLLSVEATTLPDHTGSGTQDTTDTSATAWRSIDRILPVGGYNGGGMSSTSATSTSDIATLGVRIHASGTATLNFQRHGGGGTTFCEEAVITTYVVQLGIEWDIQRVNVTGGNGGAGIDDAADYNTGALTRTVTSANTFLWGCGWDDVSTGVHEHAITLGDGTSPVSATESTVAVGSINAPSSTIDWYVYALSHPLIDVEWAFKAASDSDGTEGTYTWTTTQTAPGAEQYSDADSVFSAVTISQRTAILTQSANNAASGVSYWSNPRATASTSWTATRSYDGTTQTWAGWVQFIDVSGVDHSGGRLPAVRISTYEITMTSVSSYDVELHHDLEADYFVILVGARGAGGGQTEVMRVTQDPFGTGDLAVSTGANIIRIERGSTGGTWTGTIQVWECLRGSDGAGFKLVDVVAPTVPVLTTQNLQEYVVALNTAVSDPDQVVPFGGSYGGGMYHTSGSVSSVQAMNAAFLLRGTDELIVRKWFGFSAAVTFTVYVVEWGSEHTVERVDVGTHTLGTPTYTSVDLAQTYDPSKSWVWWSGSSEGDQLDNSWVGVECRLGDGTDALTDTLSILTYAISTSLVMTAYVLSHTGLAVDVREQTSTASTDLDVTVDAPVRGESYPTSPLSLESSVGYRGALWWTSNDSASIEYAGSLIIPIYHSTTALNAFRMTATGNWRGYGFVIDFGGVLAPTSQRLDYSDELAPVQYLVLRDPGWDGASSLSTITSEGGRFLGPSIPASSNRGGLLAIADGTPGSDDGFDLMLVRSGRAASESLAVGNTQQGGGARFVFARTSDAALTTRWYGEHSRTLMHQAWALSTNNAWYGVGMAYSEALHKVLLAQIDGDGDNVRVWSRDIWATSWDNWSSVNIGTTPYGVDAAATNSAQVALVEAPDGGVLLFVGRDGDYTDTDVYRSTDGTNWSLHSRTLWTHFGLYGTGGGQSWAVRSGEWLRYVVLVDQDAVVGTPVTSPLVETLVSGDNGSSWRRTAFGADRISTLRFVSSGDLGTAPVALVGHGDASGTCYLFYLPTVATPTVRVASAARDDDWTEYTGVEWDLSSFGSSPAVKGLCAVNDGSRIWVYAWVSWSTGDEIVVWWCDLANDPTVLSNWTEPAWLTQFNGAIYYGWHQMRAVWAGNCALVAGGRVDSPSSGATTDWSVVDGMSLLHLGGVDLMPLQWTAADYARTDYLIGDAHELSIGQPRVLYQVINQWHAALGTPDQDGASTWTPQTNQATTNAQVQQVEISCYTDLGGQGYNYFELDEGTPSDPLDYWGTGGIEDRGTTFRLVFGNVSTVRAEPGVAEDIGLRIRSHVGAPTITGGYDFSLRIGRTGIRVYDNVAAGFAGAAASTEDFRVMCDLRVTVQVTAAKGRDSIPSGFARVTVRWRRRSAGPAGAWNFASWDVDDSDSGVASQRLHVGVIGQTAVIGTSTCAWEEIEISYRNDLAQGPDLTMPDEGSGIRAEGASFYLDDGVRARWVGPGGVEGDTHELEPEFARGRSNLTHDSPRLMWESADNAAQSLDFNDTYPTSMSALLLVGTVDRTATLSFASTQAGLDSPALSVDLNADLFVDLTVVAVDGYAVKVEAAPGGTLPQRGEVLGLYLRAVLAGSASGHTYTVVGDVDVASGWLVLNRDAGDEGVEIGASCVIYGDRMLWQHENVARYPWWRIAFPDLSSVTHTISGVVTEVGTPTFTHRIGSILPGWWQRFSVPIDWRFRDHEEPHVSRYKTKSGVDWVYEEGPAQRVIDGRVVGDDVDERRLLRDVLRQLHGYEVHPVGIVLNADDVSRGTVVYGRWRSGSKMDQSGWNLDDDGVWYPVGDVDVVVSEVV